MKIPKQKLSLLKLLQNRKYRYRENLFILEGEKIIGDAVKFGAEILFVAYSPKFLKTPQDQEFINFLKNRKIETYEISDSEIEKLSDVETSQGIMAVARMFSYEQSEMMRNLQKKKTATIVALEKISDPGNLGTIFRACDWFGVDLILISDMSVDVFNPKVVRSTMGSIFNVPFLQELNLKDELENLRKLGFKIFSATPKGKSDFHEILKFQKIALVFGSESHGVSPEIIKISDETIRIKKFGKAESLNVAISTGIILSERAYAVSGQR